MEKKWDTVIPADFKRLFVSSIAHSIICTVRLFGGKMHFDWFNGMEILQGRWQHGEEVGYCYPSGLEKTLCKWDVYVPLVMKGLKVFPSLEFHVMSFVTVIRHGKIFCNFGCEKYGRTTSINLVPVRIHLTENSL